MNIPDEASALIRYSGFLFFIVLSVGAVLWFVWASYTLYEQISKSTSVVIYDNSGFYMLGVVVGLFALTYAALHEVILRLSLTVVVTKIITRVAIIGIGLTFIIPLIANYVVENHMESNDYMICNQASSRWLMYKHHVYVSNDNACIDMIAEKEKRLLEPLF